ncbi:MAG: hypothetical protein QNJ71_04975 [Acidimicrobiia bacterium]|nr:hypothetical protein [Acidimicrobiia bacterium]
MRLVLDARTAAFAGLVDYGGVFPPASLTMSEALEEYLTVRRSDVKWIVGRFLTRASQLEELAAAATSLLGTREEVVGVGVVFDMSPGAAAALCGDFANEMDPAMTIVSVEAKTPRSDPEAIAQVVEAAGSLDSDVAMFIEVVPGEPSAGQVDAIGANLRARGRSGGAKLRCGGLRADDFPTVDEVTDFIWEATNEQVPFKAAACLHEPIRHRDDRLDVWQHGFLNLLLASVAANEGAPKDTVRSIVAEADAEAFSVTATEARWRDFTATGTAIRRSRRDGFIALGSCDIAEPIEALRHRDLLGEGT